MCWWNSTLWLVLTYWNLPQRGLAIYPTCERVTTMGSLNPWDVDWTWRTAEHLTWWRGSSYYEDDSANTRRGCRGRDSWLLLLFLHGTEIYQRMEKDTLFGEDHLWSRYQAKYSDGRRYFCNNSKLIRCNGLDRLLFDAWRYGTSFGIRPITWSSIFVLTGNLLYSLPVLLVVVSYSRWSSRYERLTVWSKMRCVWLLLEGFSVKLIS